MTDAISANPALFEKAVAKLAARPAFMAYPLSVVLSGDLSTSRIAAELNCPPANALRLALMTVPRSERELFREDVARMAETAGIDRMRLLALLRQAQSLIAFETDAQGNSGGMLLAARDVVPGSDDREG